MAHESHHPLLSKAPTPTPPLLLISLRKHKSTLWTGIPHGFLSSQLGLQENFLLLGDSQTILDSVVSSRVLGYAKKWVFLGNLRLLQYVRMCFDFWYVMFWVDLALILQISSPWAFQSLTNKSRVPMYFDKYILPHHKRHHYINYIHHSYSWNNSKICLWIKSLQLPPIWSHLRPPSSASIPPAMPAPGHQVPPWLARRNRLYVNFSADGKMESQQSEQYSKSLWYSIINDTYWLFHCNPYVFLASLTQLESKI